MNATPKTIQIVLPGGDPRGIRVAEITTRIVQVIEVLRSLLQDFLKMPESGQVALYFLFGEEEDGTEQKVYLGQTGDLRARLGKHNNDKDFWERALIGNGTDLRAVLAPNLTPASSNRFESSSRQSIGRQSQPR
jgi:hypothetical protein